MKVSELMEATAMKRNALDNLLARMLKDQAVQKIKQGLYAHKDYEKTCAQPCKTAWRLPDFGQPYEPT
jgi:hypothetical protein